MSALALAADKRHRAEEAASGFPALLVAAQRVAATIEQGVHGRRRPGPGETFWQFKTYQSGDSAALIDWRQSAKSRRLFVREQEWEAAESVWLWVDQSPSMDFKSRAAERTKLDRALVLGLAVALLLVRAGEQVAWLGPTGRATHGNLAIDRLIQSLSAEGDTTRRSPPRLHLPRHSHLIMISDFLDPPEQWDNLSQWYLGSGVTGHFLQVLDPAEETLPFQGRVLFEGMETEGSTTIGKVEAIRATYMDRLQALQAHYKAQCGRNGWSFGTHRTDQSAETALMTLYLAMSGRLGQFE